MREKSFCHPELVSGSHCCVRQSRKFGFTLAEVLITLGIIGVVAALTMPTLVANYQKKQTVTQLKKAYSEINQAIRMAESGHGTIDSWDFSNFETPADRSKYFSENYLFPNIKVLKSSRPASTDCWAEEVYNLDGDVYPYLSNGNRACFSTPSGYSVYYWLHANGNGGWFWVDINGAKKPNTIGKDVFPLIMGWGNCDTEHAVEGSTEVTVKKGLNLYGVHSNVFSPTRDDLKNGNEIYGGTNLNNCIKNSGSAGAGFFCGALIQYDGWEIAPDYPW